MAVPVDEAGKQGFAGEIDKQQTMDSIEEGWTELNEDEGIEEQLAIFSKLPHLRAQLYEQEELG